MLSFYKAENWSSLVKSLLDDNFLKTSEPGGWTEWNSWSPCHTSGRTCGPGVEASRRECTNPGPKNGGENCTGEMFRTRDCNTCPGKIRQ